MTNNKVGPVRWLAALLAAFMISAAAQAPQRLTLNFANTDIEAVARAMADFTGRTFIVDPRVKGTVNLNVDQPMTPDEALAALTTALRLQNIALVDAGGVIRVVPEADAKLQGGPVQLVAPVGKGEQIVTQIFKLNYESAVAVAQVLRPLVTANNPINAYPGNNTIVVTDYAENVRRLGRIIAAIDTPSASEIDVIRLNNAIASDMAVLLARLLEGPTGTPGDISTRVSILAEPTTNSLLVRAPTPGKVIWPFATPIARPCPTLPGFCATPRMFWPEVPKFVPARPPVPPVPCRLPRPACHWMPHSAAWSLVTSMIRLSMNTCARRMSSLSITARRLR